MFDVSWFLTFLVALVTWYLASHWMKTRALPAGPFPLPIVGNFLSLRKMPLRKCMDKYRDQYGEVFTLWFGSVPYVIVMDHRLIRQALLEKRHDFSGRPEIPLVRKLLKNNMSISSTDYSKQWEILRNMGHAATRKYAVSENLPPLIDELTEEIVREWIQQEEPFNPKDYIHHLVFNILAITVLGDKFPRDDPVFTSFRQSIEQFQKYMNRGVLGYFMPILRPFLRGSAKQMVAVRDDTRQFLDSKLKESIHTYQPNDSRHMIDCLLNARDNLVKELGQENTRFLHDGNISQAIMDIFGAGIDTTNTTIRWLLLYAAMYPDVQEKIIQEIQDKIGDRMPTQDDRKRCPYIMAVITEIMRIQAVAPLGVPHKTLQDTEIGGNIIPKGTPVLFNYGAVHMDEKLWSNPEKFLPERFLDSDGQFSDARSSQYMPFGIGRRSCIGEKLATEDIFLVVAGLFRRCRLTLENPPEDLNSETVFFQIPKTHTMLAKKLSM